MPSNRPRVSSRGVAKLVTAALILSALTAGAPAARAQTIPSKPTVTGVRFQSITKVDKLEPGMLITFRIEITGENFGDSAAEVKNVQLVPVVGVAPTDVKVVFVTDKSIVIEAKAPIDTVITPILLEIRGTPFVLRDTLTLKETPDIKVEEFEFKMALNHDELYKNLYSLVLTSASDVYSDKLLENSLDLVPGGYTNLRIEPTSNTRQLIVSFLAPEGFDVKNAVATVYNGTDLATRKVLRVGKLVKEFKANPDQPKIDSTTVLALRRSSGIGRLRIEGSGFGKYDLPPVPADAIMRAWIEAVPALHDAENEFESNPTGPAPPIALLTDRTLPMLADNAFKKWNADVRKQLQISLTPRNPLIRILDTQILYVDDKMIDVCFAFSHIPGYSEPFRLASTSLTVKKPVKTTQTLKSGKVTGTAEGESISVFAVSKEVGPKVDQNIEYRYSILDQQQANYLFGSGVAETFHVIEISLVNKGAKKVSVPLAAIQAEILWPYGFLPDKKDGETDDQSADEASETADQSKGIQFFDGPVTISPVPLPAVSAYFDVYTKTRGKRAKFFNVLAGMATLGASLVPIFGPGFKDAHVIFTGGLVPGLKTAVGDLSGQQLQNLTALSWETVEVVAAAGGSVNKYVFIPRGVQLVGPGSAEVSLAPVQQEIRGILGVEITGYEVTESEAKQAAPQ